MTGHDMPDTGWEIHTRHDDRLVIPRSEQVWVDFDDPALARKRWRVQILDISEGGLGFVCLADRPRIEDGTRLTGATIHTGGWKIWGDLEITHVSYPDDKRRTCGARFVPRSESERIKLKTLVAGISRTADARSPESLGLAGRSVVP